MSTWTLTIPDYTPMPLNQLLSAHPKRRGRLKRGDADLVGAYARLQEIPRALGPRRVTVEAYYPPRVRRPDPDALWKGLLDALVHARLLVNDSAPWVTLGAVVLLRGARRETRITLEDLE